MNRVKWKNTYCPTGSESLSPPSINIFISYKSVPPFCHPKFLPPSPKRFFHIWHAPNVPHEIPLISVI